MNVWTRWTRPQDEALDEVADAARAELSAMDVPADERLLERVLESRRRGRRVLLPLEDPAPRRLSRYVGAAFAAAVVALFAVQLATRDRGPVSGGGWFVGDRAFAQPRAESPAHPGVRVTHAERMRPLRLTYRSTVRTGVAVTTRDIALSAARDAVDGAPAWRVVSITRGPGAATQADSVWVSAATLAPLRRSIVESPYRRYERIEIRQDYRGLRVSGEMKAFRGSAVAAHRRLDRTLPAAFAPYATGAFVPFVHTGVALDPGWSGSLSLLGWAVRDDDVFTSMAMRVDGEESLRLPAGTFACWRLAIDFADGQQLWYWVRQSDGLGVRSLDSTDVRRRGLREIVLSREQSP